MRKADTMRPTLSRSLSPSLRLILGLGLLGCTSTLFTTGCGDPADKLPPAEIVDAASVGAPPAATLPQSDPTTPTQTSSVPALATDPEAPPAAIYLIAAENSEIGFVASKVTRSHEGGFKNFEGYISVREDSHEKSIVDVEILTESIWSDDEGLTSHLKSPDFFDTDKFPRARFTSVTLVETGNQQYEVTGALDLHGVQQYIKFPATIKVDKEQVSVKSEFTINRLDFEINYKGMADDLIRDKVILKLNLKAARVSDPAEVQKVLATEKWKLDAE